MDGTRFDRLTKTLGNPVTRRTGLGLLAAIGVYVAIPERPDAKQKCKPKCSVCKRCSRGKCKPRSGNPFCPGGRCQGGRCVPTPPCGSDNMCGSDANGACTCDDVSRSCVTNFSPTEFVTSCSDCPFTTVCVEFFEGLACIPRCRN